MAIKGTQSVSLKTIFKVTGGWLLLSASSLIANGIDRLFAGDWITRFQGPLFSITVSESMEKIVHFTENISGFRFQPSPWHLGVFLVFWVIVIYKDPLSFKNVTVLV